ncbi:MAG TPA: PfkB family carbohydrate kinase, partial [bacterium]|nr:PfkB family carbohydrate kinase [bacterium]
LVVLNAAPWQELPESWWGLVDGWIFNEVEAEGCFGPDGIPLGYTGHPLLEHAFWVIVTRGDQGVEVYTKGGCFGLKAHRVEAVDTVGAGDSFVGALVYQLAQGTNLKQAAQFANAAAGLCCTYRGALPSLPTLEQVEAFRQQVAA